MGRLVVLTQTFDREWAVLNLIELLETQTYQDYHLLIVDHGKTKANIQEGKKVKVIHASSNLWWTGATNYGIKFVLENFQDRKYTKLLIINDDTIFSEDFLENAMQAATHDTNAIYGAICLNKENNKVIYANMKLDKLHATLKYLYKGDNLNEIKEDYLESDVLKGRGILLPLDVFRKVGFYSDKLPQYRADHEFSYRAKKKGYKLFATPKMILYSDLNSPYQFNKGKKWESFKKVFFGVRSTRNWRDLFYYSYLCYGFFYGTYFLLINLARDIALFIKHVV